KGALTLMKTKERDENLWKLYHKTACCFRGYNSKTWNRTDVTMPQMKVLFTLAHKGELTVSSIAKALRVKAPNITFILDRLEEQELVSRTRSREDRRLVSINLISKGQKLIDELMREKYESFQKVLEKMTGEEKKALLKGLQALEKACMSKRLEDSK
ncbi:MAG: MarR family transcriptional regulator, partial [Actinomycetia bacterium]|nr:MarR family transcriptional regulator [Actinomycetes bacterium]